MFDWLGSLCIRQRSEHRVELGLARTTQAIGWGLLLVGALAAAAGWRISPWLALGPALLATLGLILVSLRREVIVDRGQGTITVDQRVFGVGNPVTVPLFHLRAVVVFGKDSAVGGFRHALPTRSRFIAYLDRRVGTAIYLDEARRSRSLMKLAEAIAEVAEVRLEYEAPRHAAHS